MIGKYALHSECGMRVTCGKEILFAKSDIFIPSSELRNKEGFKRNDFDWDVLGNNYFDEMLVEYITKEPFEFTVKKIEVNKFGDLKIIFMNNFAFEYFLDRTDENWRFFEHSNLDSHLVIAGNEIEPEEEEEEGRHRR